MLRSFTRAFTTALLLAASVAKADNVNDLCSLPTGSLVAAQAQDPDCAFALTELKKHAIATWYNDRQSQSTCDSNLRDLVSTCPESSRIAVVVYGLPNKDCADGFSSDGFNKNDNDYKNFIQKLATAIGQRKALLVLEPDAVGLLTGNKCGNQHNYGGNIKTALSILSANPNADIYLDVGYWTLNNPTDAAAVAETVKDLAKGGRVKGITLNTSNYRSNKEISSLCSNFQTAYGDSSMHCIADTSRNYRDPTSNEWCNAKFGAIGKPPTSQTGYSNLDYFIWLKPPGESDGTCDSAGQTGDSMKGPPAGQFFKEQFVQLWNQGYFVAEKGMPKIGENPSNGVSNSEGSPEPSTTQPPTSAPTSSSPEPSTTQPPTSAPTSSAPATSLPPKESVTQTPESAPGPSPNTKPNDSNGGVVPGPTAPKKRKRCRSELDKDSEYPGADVVYTKGEEVTAAPAISPPEYTAQSVRFEADPSQGTASISAGAVGGVVAIAVVGIAIVGVVMRRGHTQKRLQRLRTPAKTFEVWQPTPSSVAII